MCIRIFIYLIDNHLSNVQDPIYSDWNRSQSVGGKLPPHPLGAPYNVIDWLPDISNKKKYTRDRLISSLCSLNYLFTVAYGKTFELEHKIFKLQFMIDHADKADVDAIELIYQLRDVDPLDAERAIANNKNEYQLQYKLIKEQCKDLTYNAIRERSRSNTSQLESKKVNTT